MHITRGESQLTIRHLCSSNKSRKSFISVAPRNISIVSSHGIVAGGPPRPMQASMTSGDLLRPSSSKRVVNHSWPGGATINRSGCPHLRKFYHQAYTYKEKRKEWAPTVGKFKKNLLNISKNNREEKLHALEVRIPIQKAITPSSRSRHQMSSSIVFESLTEPDTTILPLKESLNSCSPTRWYFGADWVAVEVSPAPRLGARLRGGALVLVLVAPAGLGCSCCFLSAF